MYKVVVARDNDLAADRPDIVYSVQGFAIRMSKTKESDFMTIKKLGKYLKGKPRMVISYRME